MKTKSYSIKDDERKVNYHSMEIEDFEYVNPIIQISSIYINGCTWFEKNLLTAHGLIAPNENVDEFLFKKAVKEWSHEYKRIISIPVPSCLSQVLEAKTKKEQIKSLKGLSLNSDELTAFIFMAYNKYGYTYSQYSAKHYHTGFDETQLPDIIYVDEDNTLTTVGKTTLSEGQQRTAIEHRKVTVSKFLDRENNWHCFFLTFRSLLGKENNKYGQPHLHYISDKWNIKREKVLLQLTSKDYSLPSLPHINFHTHRNPK